LAPAPTGFSSSDSTTLGASSKFYTIGFFAAFLGGAFFLTSCPSGGNSSI